MADWEVDQLRNMNRFIEEISTLEIDPEILLIVPESIVAKFGVLPYRIEDDTLYLLAGNFLVLKSQIRIEKLLNTPVHIVFAEPDLVQAAIERHYGVAMQRGRNVLVSEKQAQNVGNDDITDTTLLKKVNDLLSSAIRRRVTDINISPEELESRVFFKIDGKKVEVTDEFPIPIHEKSSVVRQVKVMCIPQIDGSDKMPHDGGFTYKGEDGNLNIDCRVSTMPTIYGENLVIRLLDSGQKARSVTDLGYPEKDVQLLIRAAKRPGGIFIVCGPVGSGKNTTLTSLIRTFNPDEYNILTVEDPVEYKLPGVNQVQLRYAKDENMNLTFEKVLRSMVRQNLDIAMISEIRDSISAGIAIEAALTGHRIFSTIHAQDGIAAFPRLFDLGVDRRLLLDVLSCIVAQRLLPLVCDNCSEIYKPDEEVLINMCRKERENIIRAAEAKQLKKGKGCKKCQGLGVYGRIAVGEIIMVDPFLRDYLMDWPGFQKIINILREQYKFRSMREKGLDLVLDGKVALLDFEDIVPNSEWSCEL